ncbi:sulfurtransferase TusA family protein [Pacificimonas sp. WHA3]|uniref:Sulfurtransferase TusA family protein n=1 Tax=Pacificimonas pallii TaxID=2827236 RepID=A0ABS6SH63_9SPHN|nr:sulfurtransferase TusA family protein [Pacificimonas pallii]MBV7257236.1 sulfurtransferase TusA family protein [Pacificimonas pallii]
MPAKPVKNDAATAVDARGLRCPLPVLRLRKAAISLPLGSVLDVTADDPAAERDVPVFCAERGWVCKRLGDGHWRIVTA